MTSDVNTPISGSDLTLSVSGSEASPIGGLLLMPDGEVNLFMAPSPVPESDNVYWKEWQEAADVTSFLLYALERPDWINEWKSMEAKLIAKWEAQEAAKERARLKAKFRLIQGGVSGTNV